MRCDLRCPHGYLTDVEGNYVCVCYNPCENVRCFGKTTCVVDTPKNCHLEDHCRPRAMCRDDLHHEPSSQTLGPAQNDDATTTSSEASRPQLCFLPVSEEAKKCRTLRMRWFFDVTTGACKEFAGCREKGGNNFKKRKSCEKTCALPKPSTKSQDVTPEEKVASDCSLPVVHVATGCRKVHKRWYFDPTKASCQRFDGCETPGNNFRTKKQCKHVCTSKRKLTRVKGLPPRD
ncbi:papilin-like isoform X2 [Pomacea canaliculata]|uniref:papilin-like isoform X2 n=1 Tax=Pomacea canaliculata TaxID=400727 RepID=UPI000D729868|nr:papilin-like isoform X2 [Pomacea canaliculata]